MSKDERFTWKTVHGWQTPAFLKVMNGLDKKNQQLKKENEQLKQSNQEAIGLIYDGIVEMYDGKRDYAEKLLNKAIELIK